MQSVADMLRDESRALDRARTPAERLRLALELGDADCRLLAAYRGISVEEARRILAHGRQHGRIRSACQENLRT
jgi:hypothetical protein